MEMLEEHRCFEGWQQRWRHDSSTLNCPMTFSIFLPPPRDHTPPPVLYWLSGLTCNDVKLRAGVLNLGDKDLSRDDYSYNEDGRRYFMAVDYRF